MRTASSTLAALATFAALAGASLTAPLPAQEVARKPELMRGAETAAFIVRLGNDTVAVERVARSKTRIEGEQVLRSPSTTSRRYALDLGPGGEVTRFELAGRRLDNSAPAQHWTADFGADSVKMQGRIGEQTRTASAAARGAIPFVFMTYGTLELATMRAAAAGADSVDVPVVPLGAAQPATYTVKRIGGDSVTITSFPGQPPYRARVDRQGRILGLQGMETTVKVLVERVKDADLAALATDFAARDAAGRALGAWSTADSVSAAVGGATVAVKYSRPSMRGRRIMGAVVPWNAVWRTGANAATTFTTDVDLDVNGTTVPAGSYTLWTLPTQTGWTLIVSKQTRDPRDPNRPLWGTDYDPAQDLARIPMTVERVAQPVERFTITLEPSSAGSALRMAWENTAVSVPVRPKG